MPPRPAPSSLTGVWEGTSSSRSDDPTDWRDTVLLFLPFEDSGRNVIYEIVGKGVSFWRNMEIDFTINGTLDPISNSFTLNKCHQGKYTNTVQYTGTLSFSSASDDSQPTTGSAPQQYRLTGVYPSGVISLSQQSPSGPIAAVCSLLSRPTWQGASISTTKDETSWEDVTLFLSPKGGGNRSSDASEEEEEEHDDDDNDDDLSDVDGARRPSGLVLSLTGSGVSLWRSLRINFYLRGTLNLKTGFCRLEKEHRGQYSNTIKYSGALDEASCCISGRYDMGRIELYCGPAGDTMWRGFHGRLLGLAIRQCCGGGEGGEEEEEEPEVDGRAGEDDIRHGNNNEPDENQEEKYAEEDADAATRNPQRADETKEGRSESRGADNTNGGGGGGGSRDAVVGSAPGASRGGGGGGIRRKAADESSKCRDDQEDYDNDLCKICFVNTINTVIIPCGHFCSCLDCGRRLDAECPICRGPIAKVQEVFRA